MMKRCENNPLLTPDQIKPTRDDFRVVGVFNPAVTWYRGEILLLLRIAEEPLQREKDIIRIPILEQGRLAPDYSILKFARNDKELDARDPRFILYGGKIFLTSISHLRIARSRDGVEFQIDEKPTLLPEGYQEGMGIEDARITVINGVYYINYTSASESGYSTSLITTADWQSYKRHGAIFHPLNKDVAIFPKKVNGEYVALHRPDTGSFQKPSMWLSYSADLVHWGNHQHLMSPKPGTWYSKKIGAGAPPIYTKKGWLEIFHGVSEDETYSLGALLLDLDSPSRILSVSPEPILVPDTYYEQSGFVQRTVFTDGLIQDINQPDRILLYYGAADQHICLCEFSLKEMLDYLCNKRVEKESVNDTHQRYQFAR